MSARKSGLARKRRAKREKVVEKRRKELIPMTLRE